MFLSSMWRNHVWSAINLSIFELLLCITLSIPLCAGKPLLSIQSSSQAAYAPTTKGLSADAQYVKDKYAQLIPSRATLKTGLLVFGACTVLALLYTWHQPKPHPLPSGEPVPDFSNRIRHYLALRVSLEDLQCVLCHTTDHILVDCSHCHIIYCDKCLSERNKDPCFCPQCGGIMFGAL